MDLNALCPLERGVKMLLVIDSSQRPTAGGVAMPEKARSYLVLME